MKYKTQEEPQENRFLNRVKDLLILNREFSYAIEAYRIHNNKEKLSSALYCLSDNFNQLMNLCIALDDSHKAPNFNVSNESVDLNDLVKLEENYYANLVELGTLGLEEGNFEIVAYLSEMVRNFQHIICRLANESNSTL